MAGKEGAPKPVVDRTLDAWQKWNKFTLGIEGAAIVGGFAFGIPLLMTLGAAGAVVDGAQIVALDEIKKAREEKAKKQGSGEKVVYQAKKAA